MFHDFFSGLTPARAAVLYACKNPLTVEEVAMRVGISAGTARGHLQVLDGLHLVKTSELPTGKSRRKIYQAVPSTITVLINDTISESEKST